MNHVKPMRYFIQMMLTLPILLMLVLTLTGCKFTKSVPDPPADISGSIKIMYYNEYDFMNRYGFMFSAKYPYIDFEIIPLHPLIASFSSPDFSPDRRLAAYAQFIQDEQPDIISGIPEPLLRKLIDEGWLYDMEPRLTQQKYDLSTIHPAITQYIRHLGNGRLYLLAPIFSSPFVLFLNSDLFEEYEVEIPKKIENWEDLFLLAQRFPTNGDTSTRIFGYTHTNDYSSNPASVLMDIYRNMGLFSSGNQTILDTDKWKSLTALVISAFRSGTIQYSESNNFNFSYPYREMFKKGRTAITMGNSSTLQNLQLHFQNSMDGPFHWEVLNLPGEHAVQAKNFSLQEVFAIHAASPFIDAALEFMKFSSGEDVARIHSKNPSVLWSRTTQQTTRKGQSLEPFYQLFFNPDFETPTPDNGEWQVGLKEWVNSQLDQVIAGSLTVEEAVVRLQTRLQQELDNIHSSG